MPSSPWRCQPSSVGPAQLAPFPSPPLRPAQGWAVEAGAMGGPPRQHVPWRQGAEPTRTLRWHRCHSVSVLQKLPFTIPELVQSSPCRSSDGVLYTGTRALGQGPVAAGGSARGAGGLSGTRAGADPKHEHTHPGAGCRGGEAEWGPGGNVSVDGVRWGGGPGGAAAGKERSAGLWRLTAECAFVRREEAGHLVRCGPQVRGEADHSLDRGLGRAVPLQSPALHRPYP